MEILVSQGLAVRRWLPDALIFLLAASSGAYGQQAQPLSQMKPMAQLPIVQNLKVIVLAGKDEMNDLERHVMAPLVVDVLDQNDRPVEGADVVFRFPLQGPGASFSDQKTTQTVRTNAQGEAAARNWMANNHVGPFQVHATATYGNQMGETTISMSNVTRIVEINKNRKHQNWWSTRKFKIAVIAGGAAAVAAIVLVKESGSSKSTSTPTVTITPGAPSVGGP
jgi:hypothetical protein